MRRSLRGRFRASAVCEKIRLRIAPGIDDQPSPLIVDMGGHDRDVLHRFQQRQGRERRQLAFGRRSLGRQCQAQQRDEQIP
ncbi:MAG: hypothetical protein WDN69_02455 [Aliidongia sp.]